MFELRKIHHFSHVKRWGDDGDGGDGGDGGDSDSGGFGGGGGWGSDGYGGGGWGTGGYGSSSGFGDDDSGFGGMGGGWGVQYGGIYGDPDVSAGMGMMGWNAGPIIDLSTPESRQKVFDAMISGMGFGELSDRYGFGTALGAKLSGPLGGFATGMLGPAGGLLGIGMNEYAKSNLLGEAYSPSDLAIGLIDRGVKSTFKSALGPTVANMGYGIGGLPGAMLGAIGTNLGVEKGYGALKGMAASGGGFGSAGRNIGGRDPFAGSPMGFELPQEPSIQAGLPSLASTQKGWYMPTYGPGISTNRTFT